MNKTACLDLACQLFFQTDGRNKEQHSGWPAGKGSVPETKRLWV